MRPLLPLALAVALALTGCEAGNRADPGGDNALHSPALVVSTPFEGQQVVPTAADGAVTALFDLQGAALGRCAGSKVRWRLDEGPWTVVDDATRAVRLGALAARTDPEKPYVLTAEAIDKDGQPWTREEVVGTGEAATKRTLNAGSRVVRHFTVHRAWADAAAR